MAIPNHRLVWRADRQVYELYEPGSGQLLPVVSDEEKWFAWLETIPSFSFCGQPGHLKARKEARAHGDQYWYAYRRVGPKMAKKYLGRSADLTLARLEAVAGAFPAVERHVAASSRPPRDLLLATKLNPPRSHSQLVSRSHLTLRLQQGMGRALTLVSAPAGFGKTTLLSQWLVESRTPAAWLSLEAGDNEPIRFFSYLLAALQTLYPQAGTVSRSLLEASQHLSLERVLTLLLNDLLEFQADDFALVLDDYHVIEDPAIHRGISFLLDHLLPQMHLVLATRADPPLPLARLRARGQLTEVRAAEKRCSLANRHRCNRFCWLPPSLSSFAARYAML